MNAPGITTTNIAKDSANVALQAGVAVVHEFNQIYQVLPDATPQEKYEVGVRHLDNGMPKRARELIDDAVTNGYLNSEVRFHQLLALLSGRTLQQLSNEDFARLEAARECPTFHADDEWADGIKMIDSLLGNIAASNDDHPIGLAELDKLGELQSRKIPRHLEMFLKGPLEDQAWRRAINEAREGQKIPDRTERTWKFFEPEPEGPRRLRPAPITTTVGVRIRAAVTTAVFASAAGYLGLLLVQRGHVWAILAYLASVLGGYIWALNGVEWRFGNERLRAKNREYRTPRQRQAPPSGGFASQVDRLFHRYFGKYVPDGVDRATWLAETAGLRRSIRDEVVNAYRDSTVEADAIAWLIRYRVGAVKQRWQRDTLWDYQRRFRTPVLTKLAVVFGIGVVVVAGARALVDAVPVSPLRASISTLLVLVSGWIAAIDWLGIVVQRRRYADELDEKDRLFVDCQAAYQRWVDKLADTPSDSEMAAWLDCDRMMLMSEALQHYKLLPSNMIAHAFIEAPASSCDRARVLNGPWRFSRYQLLVFLLTTDGVRQLAVELDFHNVSFHDRRRTNYRFDAVASVHVTEGGHNERTFELALVSGQPLEIPVTGSGEEKLGKGEVPGTVADLTVDAAGLRNTLHILEGIAAEGKDWIGHEDQRSGERIRRLKRAVHGLTE
jgi:hypothetical protein